MNFSKESTDMVHNNIIKTLKPLNAEYATDVLMQIKSFGNMALFKFMYTSNGELRRKFVRDALHIRRDNTIVKDLKIIDHAALDYYSVQFNTLVDEYNRLYHTDHGGFDTLGHRDAIQLIPKDRYIGGSLNNITIEYLDIMSSGSLQGIFSSDGAFKNLTVKCCTVDTNSEHKITVAGVLNGVMYANTDAKGDYIKTLLLPLRIGGGLNYNIISFAKSSSYQYGTVRGRVVDERHKPRKHSYSVYNFNIDEFRREIGVLPYRSTKELLDKITTVMNRLHRRKRIIIVKEK